MHVNTLDYQLHLWMTRRMSHVSNGISFTEDNIYALFGNEAADSETLSRLKQYYFKTPTYDQIVGTLPLRILVGHKGIGKSALFKVAMSEDPDRSILPISIRPDDVEGIGNESNDFLTLISEWKNGLIKIMSAKILDSLGLENRNELASKVTWYTGQVINYLVSSVKEVEKHVDLDATQKLIIENFLRNRKIAIYIDDLDRGWTGKPHDVKRISALVNAVRDLSSENEGVYFRLALRSDVYFLYRTSDESTDKIEGSVIWYGWDNHEILILLAKRVETYFGRTVNDESILQWDQSQIARLLNPIMEPRFYGQGHWENIPTYRMLMSLIRKRPRDLVKLCTLAARRAQRKGDKLLSTRHFTDSFEDYSQGRLQDTYNEYRSELPAIERLLINMKPTKRAKTAKEGYTFDTGALMQKIKSVMQTGEFKFASGNIAYERDLAQFMYKINFLTALKRLPNGEIQRKYFEENRYLANNFSDFGYDWEIHPAYRWALQPDSVATIIKEMSVADDDFSNPYENRQQ